MDFSYDSVTGKSLQVTYPTSTASAQTGPGGGSSTQSLACGWDGVGNLASRQDLNQSRTESFGYDAVYRVLSLAGRDGGEIQDGDLQRCAATEVDVRPSAAVSGFRFPAGRSPGPGAGCGESRAC
jgi:hypothetical protein